MNDKPEIEVLEGPRRLTTLQLEARIEMLLEHVRQETSPIVAYAMVVCYEDGTSQEMFEGESSSMVGGIVHALKYALSPFPEDLTDHVVTILRQPEPDDRSSVPQTVN